jgi:hypothetical protein
MFTERLGIEENIVQRYGEQQSSLMPSRTPSIHLWKADGLLVKPKGMRTYSYSPQEVLNKVACLELSST